MRTDLVNAYVSPFSKRQLTLIGQRPKNADTVEDGILQSDAGESFEVKRGIPYFLDTARLGEEEKRTQAEYDKVAEGVYDNAVDWLFKSFYEDENKVREGMIDLLCLRSNSRVLEIGCGTGRDSHRIARRLSRKGVFFVQDISANMVMKTQTVLEKARQSGAIACESNYFVSSAETLPFPDHYFDAVFHFGGFNNFPDKRKALQEISRITKDGGKVVVGDESLPPWLEGTTFGDIVCTNNALFKNHVPLAALPEGARDVVLRWILGNCFYLIDFKVAEGPPPLNLDLPHKGWRGGSMRTRYYGRLEGVTPETKARAIKAAAQRQMSLHDWLEAVVRATADKDLRV